jgi:hypothetical protein
MVVAPDPIRVDNFLLADAAKVCDGKLYLHGGGWNFLNIFEPKSLRPITLAGRVVVPWDEAHRDLTLTFRLEYLQDGTVLEDAPIIRMELRTQGRPEHPEALETATPFAFEIPGVAFLQPGEYAFVIRLDEEELARTRLQVNFVGTDTQDADEADARNGDDA